MTSLPAHISYSQWKQYSSCPRSWYLARLKGGEEKQSWYLPIGTAVHDMIEEYLKADDQGSGYVLTRTVEQVFYPLVEKQMQIEPDLTKWLAGGPEAAPITHEKALQRAVECYEKALQELEAIDVWEVEYDASGRLPGLEVPVKAYVDIIGEHKTKGPVIWDWKTGSTKPDNFQLETYNALLTEVGYGHGGNMVADWKGRYIMLAPGSANTRYVSFKLTPEEVGAKYQAVYTQMKEKIYKAEAGFNCRFCFQSENCLVNKGMTQRAMYYDRSADDGLPF